MCRSSKGETRQGQQLQQGVEARARALTNDGDGSGERKGDGEDDSDVSYTPGTAQGEGSKRRHCCCRRILSEGVAFKQQMNGVQEVKERGHLRIFLPK